MAQDVSKQPASTEAVKTVPAAPSGGSSPIATPKSVFYINYFDQILPGHVKALMGVCTQIVTKKNPDVLYFLFSSPGGVVDAGITFYNFLRSLPAEIVMHNTGAIDSVATVIFLAGDRRYAAKHSSFLFHGIHTQFQRDSTMQPSGLRERLSRLETDESKITGIVAERSAMTEGEMRDLFQQGQSVDLAFAIEKKIIHEIRNPEIPKGADLVSINVN
jgi:ATP-dependent Clp protease protease subunit